MHRNFRKCALLFVHIYNLISGGKLNICKTNSEICDCESYSVTDNKSIISERTNSNNKTISKCNESTQVFNEQQKYNKETCCVHSTQVSIMNSVETDVTKDQLNKVHKIDKATLIITNTSSEESLKSKSSIINQLNNRIDYLERKIIKQELVLDSIDPALTGCSLDDERKMKRRQETFIEQYSHVPETSAFQRHIQQAAPLSPSKATTIEKEHNSEQYGRDFTAYDGITARGRRQCASVPLRRDEIPKIAAERVHKIRHKLNPVRDYRLMDTVHYLAQGEFAPRDDGIKLTPSREAVLSDIIWEDVCRTHWPTTRLSRRLCHPQRHSTRSELQRLIDNLLRERIAHVERRRRRHYKIVKLNHRHETCRPIGKTGDIIVASHKNKHLKEDSNHRNSEPATAMTSRKYWLEQNQVRKDPDKIIYQNAKDNHHACCCDVNECVPGPSHNVCSRACRKNPTYYCQTVERPIDVLPPDGKQSLRQNETRGSTSSTSNRKNGSQQKSPRFVVKKESSRRTAKDELNPEHYILLPTLVVRTPSNVRRQKTFNELYHRILNIQMQHEKERK